MPELVDDFYTLFAGRSDAFGSDTGGCLRNTDPERDPRDWYKDHLDGTRPIGVYPLGLWTTQNGMTTWQCCWACIDLDLRSESKPSGDFSTEEECHTAAVNLQRVLGKLGLVGWIERTRSCGRHLWIFADQWIPATLMRSTLLVASSIAGTPTREINPKQTTLDEGQLGNYVRLVYPGGTSFATNQIILREDGQVGHAYPVEEFVELALASRATYQQIKSVAALYQAPPPQEPRRSPLPAGPLPGNVTKLGLNPQGRHIYQHGPQDGDRSKGLAYLAHQCYLSGLSANEAYDILKACPWSKFRDRPDEAKRLVELVEHGYR